MVGIVAAEVFHEWPARLSRFNWRVASSGEQTAATNNY